MKNLFKNAKFDYEYYGSRYSKFDKTYIDKVKNYVDGNLSIFLDAILKTHGHSMNKGGNIFLNKISVDYILDEIRFFKKNKRWKDVNDK